jgi:hypothetical protein
LNVSVILNIISLICHFILNFLSEKYFRLRRLNDFKTSLFTIFRFPERIENVSTFCFFSVNRKNRSTRFQNSRQKQRKVFDAGAGGEEEHRLFWMFSNEFDETRKLFRRLAHHEVVVQRQRSRVLRRSVA